MSELSEGAQYVDPWARWTAEAVRYAPILRLVEAGFQLDGWDVTQPCRSCGHLATNHKLAMPASMAEGGWIECFADGGHCECHATWGIPQLREGVAHRFRDRGNGQCAVCGRRLLFHAKGVG